MIIKNLTEAAKVICNSCGLGFAQRPYTAEQWIFFYIFLKEKDPLEKRVITDISLLCPYCSKYDISINEEHNIYRNSLKMPAIYYWRPIALIKEECFTYICNLWKTSVKVMYSTSIHNNIKTLASALGISLNSF